MGSNPTPSVLSRYQDPLVWGSVALSIVLLRSATHVDLSPSRRSTIIASQTESCRRGGMADAEDLKSSGGNPVWVQFPPPVF